MKARRQPAPFSRSVTNLKNDLVVLAGAKAWNKARQHKKQPGSWAGRLVVAPPDADPVTLSWPARGRTVLVIREGECPLEHEQRLAASLMRDGAQRVCCIGDGRGLNVYG